MPKSKVAQVSQLSIDFSQFFEMFNSKSTELKAFSTIISVPSSYNIRPSTSVEISESAAADCATKNVPEFIHDAKSDRYLESCYSKHKYAFTANLAK